MCDELEVGGQEKGRERKEKREGRRKAGGGRGREAWEGTGRRGAQEGRREREERRQTGGRRGRERRVGKRGGGRKSR